MARLDPHQFYRQFVVSPGNFMTTQCLLFFFRASVFSRFAKDNNFSLRLTRETYFFTSQFLCCTHPHSDRLNIGVYVWKKERKKKQIYVYIYSAQLLASIVFIYGINISIIFFRRRSNGMPEYEAHKALKSYLIRGEFYEHTNYTLYHRTFARAVNNTGSWAFIPWNFFFFSPAVAVVVRTSWCGAECVLDWQRTSN